MVQENFITDFQVNKKKYKIIVDENLVIIIKINLKFIDFP